MELRTALLIGNSDGIGAETTRRLLALGFRVFGVSRSPSPIDHPDYRHAVLDVRSSEYRSHLKGLPPVDLCIYCAGIGAPIDWENLPYETEVFEVNLMAAVITTEIILGAMLRRGHGHFIGLSSVADALISSEAPSYSASKAGISRFWEGLGLASRNKRVKISNIRFGFVDTKMAKSPQKPGLLSVGEAADFILDVVRRPRIRATRPKAIMALVWVAALPNRFRLLFR